MQTAETEPRKWREAMVFFILAVVIWPILVSAFVGAYGFAFWTYFMLAGPPGVH